MNVASKQSMRDPSSSPFLVFLPYSSESESTECNLIARALKNETPPLANTDDLSSAPTTTTHFLAVLPEEEATSPAPGLSLASGTCNFLPLVCLTVWLLYAACKFSTLWHFSSR